MIVAAAVLGLSGVLTGPASAGQLSARIKSVLAGAPAKATSQRNALSGDKVAIDAGENLFQNICFSCHGREGRGDGPASEAVGPVADLADATRRPLMTDGQRFWLLHDGVPDSPMQTFGESLTHRQIWSILAYVETLSQPKKPPPKSTEKSDPATAGPTLVLGHLTVEEVTETLETVEAQLQACRSGAGEVVLQMQILETGKTFTVFPAASTLTQLSALDCMVEILEEVRFKKTEGGQNTWVFYPLADRVPPSETP